MKLLLSGLDTVECAYYLRPGHGCTLDFAALATRREAQRLSRTKDRSIVALGGVDFLLASHGTGSGYPFLMENGDSRIQFGEFNNPGFYVSYRSHALWHKGAAALHREFMAWATSLNLVAARGEGLSRVDFTFDFELPGIDFDEDSFVTVLSKDGRYRRDRKLQTIRLGEGDVVLRIYDKTAEIREKSAKTWFYALWGGVTENVWRVEFQVRKDVLKRFGIRSFDDLFAGSGDVLRYLVNEHTTLRVPGVDTNRSRWPVHPLWSLLQAHVASLEAQGIVREVNPDERLLEQMMRLAVAVEGYVKRAAAIESVRRDGAVVSHEGAIGEFVQFLRRVHDPLTWASDVAKRVDEIRLGQW